MQKTPFGGGGMVNNPLCAISNMQLVLIVIDVDFLMFYSAVSTLLWMYILYPCGKWIARVRYVMTKFPNLV